MHISEGKPSPRSGVASVIASATAGFSELLIFHPIDTIAKRLINNRGHNSRKNLPSVLFRDAANQNALTKYQSLFKGFRYAVVYKVLQRSYQFGCQPIVAVWMAGYAGAYFERKLGPRKGKTALQAFAGSLIGLGEVALLPLDSLKVKRQTGVVQGNASIFSLLRSEPRPFRGGTWTAARNMVGCFALFGASAAVKDLICAPGMTPTWTQTFFASFCGAAGCIAFASPLDVIKVRVQATPIDSHVSGLQIAKELVRKEGWSAFTKGLTPKLLATGPKLTFSFTVAQLLYTFIQGFEGIDNALLEKGNS